MRYPIIKVRDKLTGETHIVGTDTHDVLYVSDDGGIHYYNLQNGEGTGRNGDYEFVGVDNEFSPGPEIEFVLVDQTEVQRLRAALVEIKQLLNENRENDGAFQSWNHMQAWKVATQALSTTTEPKQDKTCVICGTREGKYLSTANRWFCEPCTDALPPVNANEAKVERVREGDGNDA